MKKIALLILLNILISATVFGAGRDLDIRGRMLRFSTPPFLFTLPSGLQWIHSSSVDHPAENSRTRTYLFAGEKKKQMEELLVIQIADRTNPQAGPVVVPPLKPFSEKRAYQKGIVKKGDVEIGYLIQLMAWNPDAPSLQPVVRKGVSIPSHWALQIQWQAQPRLENALSVRYSRDVRSFGVMVSDEGKRWEKDAISGNEKRAFDTFQKVALEMIDSLRFQNP